MPSRTTWDSIAGVLLTAITVLVICREWQVASAIVRVLPALVLALMAIFAFQVSWSRGAFIAVAVAMTVALMVSDPGWQAVVVHGLGTAAFIAAFFSCLSTLRSVASTSLAIETAGAYLSAQKPGRRYAALTVGGQLFALVLNYGAIQLLGTLAMANATSEPNAEIRNHRIRRMLLAIQRAFISTLPWSPLSFAMAITTSVVPGATWAKAVPAGIVTSVILAGIGWAMDTVFKPRVNAAPAAGKPVGPWTTMLPLLVLLGLLVVPLTVLHLATEVSIVGVVSVIVPLLSLAWLCIQYRDDAPVRRTGERVRRYLLAELPGYRGELTLLMMAGYIGTVGAELLLPLISAGGVDLAVLPHWLVLASFVWIVPLAGQLGMNPILAVTLISPLIPSAAAMGVEPTALVCAITAGWALSGATSPYTATTLLIGSFAGISAVRVGWVWNGAYALICGMVLSVWVIVYGYVL